MTVCVAASLSVLPRAGFSLSGRATVAGWDLQRMSARDRLAYRRNVVGFVWQQTARNLLPYLSAAENVALPMALAGSSRAARQLRAAELLDALGMGERSRRRPGAGRALVTVRRHRTPFPHR